MAALRPLVEAPSAGFIVSLNAVDSLNPGDVGRAAVVVPGELPCFRLAGGRRRASVDPRRRDEIHARRSRRDVYQGAVRGGRWSTVAGNGYRWIDFLRRRSVI